MYEICVNDVPRGRQGEIMTGALSIFWFHTLLKKTIKLLHFQHVASENLQWDQDGTRGGFVVE